MDRAESTRCEIRGRSQLHFERAATPRRYPTLQTCFDEEFKLRTVVVIMLHHRSMTADRCRVTTIVPAVNMSSVRTIRPQFENAGTNVPKVVLVEGVVATFSCTSDIATK